MRSKCAILLCLWAGLAAAQQVLIHRPGFTSLYDVQLQGPAQVEWTLRATDLGQVERDVNWKFKPDVPVKAAKARHHHYYNTGYDRGHLCPAQDRSTSRAAMQATFGMSNCSPQVPALNRGAWLQTEDSCRRAAVRFGEVRVVVTPIFLHRDTVHFSKYEIKVPHAFFKAVYTTATDSVVACWFMFNR